MFYVHKDSVCVFADVCVSMCLCMRENECTCVRASYHCCVLTYAHRFQRSIGHLQPFATALCSGPILPFQSSWSLVVSALPHCCVCACILCVFVTLISSPCCCQAVKSCLTCRTWWTTCCPCWRRPLLYDPGNWPSVPSGLWVSARERIGGDLCVCRGEWIGLGPVHVK